MPNLSSLLNQSACPNCISPAYQMNGYDYLMKGDYSGFFQHYGWQMIFAGILSFLLIHCFNAFVVELWRKDRENNNR